jgi:hypothetical protein
LKKSIKRQTFIYLYIYIISLRFIAAGLTLSILILFWLVAVIQDRSIWQKGQYLFNLVDYFIIAVSIVVVAVPEVCMYLINRNKIRVFFFFFFV